MVELAVVNADITERPCDVLLLKHANGFHGVDALVAKRIGFTSEISQGSKALVSGQNIRGREVLLIGVGPRDEFRYSQIREFGRMALEFTRQRTKQVRVICTPLHGPGYGLDEREAFLSLVGGFLDGLGAGRFPEDLERIEVVELNSRRAEKLTEFLSEVGTAGRQRADHSARLSTKTVRLAPESHQSLSSFGIHSERKTRVFVAMPFSPEHSDVWEIAIQEACRETGIICERVDEQAYTGDILAQIKSRVRAGSGVLALLNDANPNVFLEIGFAWGMGKPTVQIAKMGVPLPFDVRGQKCIYYSSIAHLRSLLTTELKALNAQGVFSSPKN